VNKIEVVSLDRKIVAFGRGIKSILKISLEKLRQDNKAVEIYLVGSAEMRFLNKAFRRKNKPTNILSFKEPADFIYPKSRFKRLGEIYVAIPYIKKQVWGNKKGEDRKAALKKLLIHGLLHLLGYTHGSERDKIKMEKKEQKLLRNV